MPNFPYTSSTVNMQIMNQFHTHSQKKQNPAKKFIKYGQIEIARRRRRWDRAVKARSVRSSDERRDRRAVRSPAKSLLPLFLSDLGSLFSLSLSLFPEMIWSENEGGKSFPGQRWKYWSTGSHFPWQPNMQVWGKMISWDHFHQNKRTLNFCLFTVLTSFLIFRNKDKLIKLGVFLEVKRAITNFLNPLNI